VLSLIRGGEDFWCWLLFDGEGVFVALSMVLWVLDLRLVILDLFFSKLTFVLLFCLLQVAALNFLA